MCLLNGAQTYSQNGSTLPRTDVEVLSQNENYSKTNAFLCVRDFLFFSFPKKMMIFPTHIGMLMLVVGFLHSAVTHNGRLMSLIGIPVLRIFSLTVFQRRQPVLTK